MASPLLSNRQPVLPARSSTSTARPRLAPVNSICGEQQATSKRQLLVGLLSTAALSLVSSKEARAESFLKTTGAK